MGWERTSAGSAGAEGNPAPAGAHGARSAAQKSPVRDISEPRKAKIIRISRTGQFLSRWSREIPEIEDNSMAKVRRTVSSHIPGVYAVETDCEYVYCDRCGSFSVESCGRAQSRTRRALSAAGGLIIVGSIAWLIAGLALALAWPVGCLTGLVGAMLALSGAPAGYLRCRKCGSEVFSDTNSLNLSEDDRGPVDVPDDLVIKRCFETRVS